MMSTFNLTVLSRKNKVTHVFILRNPTKYTLGNMSVFQFPTDTCFVFSVKISDHEKEFRGAFRVITIRPPILICHAKSVF